MYNEFIKMLGDEEPASVQRLWHSRTDEEFHLYCFLANLEALHEAPVNA